MKPRTTLILAALAGGVFAYIWFVERHTPSSREEAENSAKVVKIEQNKVHSISIQNGDSKVELRKKDEVWRVEQPLSDRADGALVGQLLGAVESLRHDSKLEIAANQEKEKWKEFGVAESDVRIKVQSDSGKETLLLLGKDSAVEGKIYVRSQGSNTVYVVSNSLKTQVTRKPDEFRDKKLSDTPSQQVQRVTVKTSEGELELEKKNNHWDLVKPLRARAADQKVNDLLAGVLTAQVSQFLPEATTPEQGLAEPRATVVLQVEGQKEPVTLKVGAAPSGDENKDRSFARLSSRAAVTVLSNSALNPLLQARPNDLRDKKLLRFESDIVDRISIQPAGQPPLLLARKGEGWVKKDGEKEVKINESIASKLLSSLQSAEVTNFVSDVASDLPKYGLDQPQVRLTLASYASENTAETKSGERALATVLFGTVEGDSGYAKIEDEPFVVASPKSLLELIPRHSAQLQPLSVWEFQADSIVAVEVAGEGAPVRVEKKEGAWKLAGGEGAVNEAAVQSLVKAAGSLRAARWMAPGESGEKEEDKPTLKLTLSQKEGEKTETLELVVGRALGEEGFYSKVSGKEGVFLLPKADYGPLGAKLTQ
ncbi:MAG: hypothetical protein RLZZ399_83 [Verrucomicrobiota bacterium]|jgi:hypothetical protein